MFKGQGLHYILLAGLLAGVVALANDGVLTGQFLGISTLAWLIIAIADPIIHQIYVWFVWRAELHFGLISKWFGKQAGFRYYTIGFSILFVSRLLTIIALAIANRNSLTLNPVIAWVLALVAFVPAIYLFYSVRHYFGMERAYGIDHFDESYRSMPFVKKGIFRFTDNAMYLFGFLILWIPGLILFSKAALLAALFNHLYIWVHYYCTELPDIHYIYGSPEKAEAPAK
jgi:hypothetical protein